MPFARRARSATLLSTPLLVPLAAFASSDKPCSAAGGVNGRLCSLDGYLHTLEVLAVLLGAILVVVILLAVAYYRKAQRMKLEP